MAQRYAQKELNEQIAPAVRGVVRAGSKSGERSAARTAAEVAAAEEANLFTQSAKNVETSIVREAQPIAKLQGTESWKSFEQVLDDKIAAEVDAVYAQTTANLSPRQVADQVATKVVIDSQLTGRKSEELVDYIVQRVNERVGYAPRVKQPPSQIEVLQPTPSLAPEYKATPPIVVPKPVEVGTPKKQLSTTQPTPESQQQVQTSMATKLGLAAFAVPAAALLAGTRIENIPLRQPKSAMKQPEETKTEEESEENKPTKTSKEESDFNFDFDTEDIGLTKEKSLGKYGGTFVKK